MKNINLIIIARRRMRKKGKPETSSIENNRYGKLGYMDSHRNIDIAGTLTVDYTSNMPGEKSDVKTYLKRYLSRPCGAAFTFPFEKRRQDIYMLLLGSQVQHTNRALELSGCHIFLRRTLLVDGCITQHHCYT